MDHFRIAFCLPEAEPLQRVWRGEPGDAAYLQQKSIAQGLLARGHELTFIAPADRAELMCTRDPLQIKKASQSWSKTRLFEFAEKGVWKIQQAVAIPYLNVFTNYRIFDACIGCLPGHALVYERYGIYNVGVAMASRRLKLPYVFFFDADQIVELDYLGEPVTGLLRRRAQRILRYNLATAASILCVSEVAKEHLINDLNVSRQKVSVFPNAVDVQHFRSDSDARRRVRASFGMGDCPVILFVGNFYGWHDVRTLLQAFQQVLACHPTVRLVLVGDGVQRQSMMQLAGQMGIGHAVQFLGLVPHAQVPGLMAAADIAVAPVPAMQEELWLSPMKLFEYMATGIAVIASASGQLAAVIQDGQNGLLVPPGDARAFAMAITTLINNPALRLQLGNRARADAVREWSWETYLVRLEDLLSGVVNRRISDPSTNSSVAVSV